MEFNYPFSQTLLIFLIVISYYILLDGTEEVCVDNAYITNEIDFVVVEQKIRKRKKKK